MTTNNGLIVRPSSEGDKEKIDEIFEENGYTAEYNPEFGMFLLPEDNLDSLEKELQQLFDGAGINASFESY